METVYPLLESFRGKKKKNQGKAWVLLIFLQTRKSNQAVHPMQNIYKKKQQWIIK